MEAGTAEGTTHPKKREILIGGRIFLVVCTRSVMQQGP